MTSFIKNVTIHKNDRSGPVLNVLGNSDYYQCSVFIHIHYKICYRINLYSQPRHKMKVKGFDSRGMKCITNTDRKFIADSREVLRIHVFHKISRIYRNLFHLSIEEELRERRRFEYHNDSSKESARDIYQFYIVCVRQKCIFFLSSFKFKIVTCILKIDLA